MKIKEILFVLVLISLISIANSAVHINTTVKFNSLELETYGLEKCTVEGVCEYYESNNIIMLEFDRDHIIKIVPKKHYLGISGGTIYKYLNVTFIFSVASLIALVFLVFWLINTLTGK